MGKKGGWTVMVGGKGTGKPRLADTLAENFDSDGALALIEKIVAYYCAHAKRFERIGKMIDRLGFGYPGARKSCWGILAASFARMSI